MVGNIHFHSDQAAMSPWRRTNHRFCESRPYSYALRWYLLYLLLLLPVGPGASIDEVRDWCSWFLQFIKFMLLVFDAWRHDPKRGQSLQPQFHKPLRTERRLCYPQIMLHLASVLLWRSPSKSFNTVASLFQVLSQLHEGHIRLHRQPQYL